MGGGDYAPVSLGGACGDASQRSARPVRRSSTAFVTYDIICNMKRTTIFMDETVEQDLRLLAKRRAKPVAALVREALATYVTEHRRAARDLPTFVAAGRSGHQETAERHEELLFEELNPHSTPPPSGKTPRSRARKRS